MNISSGTRLGQYEIVDRLGAGGMGEVYRARDTRLGRDVALKALSGELSLDPVRLSRFEAEARSASALNHPSIVTIHEIGQDDGTPFIVMELVDGKTLRELLYAGALPLRRTVALAAQLADALARAHEAGIVHRDLKPENVMVTRDGLLKILDFGLAKIESRDGENGADRRDLTVTEETREGAVVGTSGYMSPEQASGQPVDFRSDQFAFGTVLYELLTGKRAFHAASRAETLAAIIRDEAEPIGTIAPRVPPPLRWIVERCLAKLPEERYASTRDLARDLQSVRDHFSQIEGEASPLVPSARRRARGWLPAGSRARGRGPRRLRLGLRGRVARPRPAILPAADVPRRNGVVGAGGPRRADHRLRRGVGHRPDPPLFDAPRDSRVRSAPASPGERPRDLPVRGDGRLARRPADRAVRDGRHARALDARRRRAARSSRSGAGRRLGGGRREPRRRAVRRRAKPAGVSDR